MNLNCDTGSLAPSILFVCFEEEGEVLEKYITDVNLHGPVMGRSLRSLEYRFWRGQTRVGTGEGWSNCRQ